MRTAASQNNLARQPIIQGASVPAPVGGWNARDSVANMEATDAVILDNYFPSTGTVNLRRGFTSYATGMSGAVQSLMEWAGPASRKFKAAVDGKIYDVTASGAVGAAEISGLTNNKWQHINYGTGGNYYLLMVNGQDSYRAYDGTSWTTPAVTNLTAADAIQINSHQRRLWFVEKNSLSAWYLGTDAIAGAASEVDFSSLASMGGTLMAMATWTVDGGNGSDDLAVFITSQGQVIVFAGTNPADATLWGLQGVYQVGRPIGRRCFQKFGADLIIITEDGFEPLSKSMITGRQVGNVSISDKISGAVNAAVRMYKSNFGWQPLHYPKGTQLIFNIPLVENSIANQYVMNTITGAWCRFTNQNANCFGLYNDEAYFGGNGVVYKADNGESDAGADTEGDVKPAFNYFGAPGVLKRFTLVQPIFTSEGTILPAFSMNVDFEDDAPTSSPAYSGSSGSPWDTSPWNTSPWDVGLQVRHDWQSVAAIGYCGALRMQTASKNFSVSLSAINYQFEMAQMGGGL